MGRLIDADALRARMYHESFETDSDMQRWDGGCWIRYKLFEKCLNEQPTVQPQTSMLAVECKFDDEELAKAIEEVKKANTELIAAASHWIPCSERLPEEDFCSGRGVQYSETVLVTVVNNGDDDDTFVDMACTADGVWQLNYPQDTSPLIPKWCKVIAWMPLPDPYKEET